MLLVGLIMLALGAALLTAGRRGRVVGHDPHCQQCGFNLRGRDPKSLRCPECGTELSESAISIGQWQRRSAALNIGLILLLIGIGSVGWSGWQFAQSNDWSSWKPASWLLADLDSSDGRAVSAARNELRRRVGSREISSGTLDAVVDNILARQPDRTKKWDTVMGEIIEVAARQRQIDRPRLERYLKQGASAALYMKPKIRRGQPLEIEIEFRLDRYGPQRALTGTWKGSPIMLDDVMLRQDWAGQATEGKVSGLHYFGTISGGKWSAATLPDGKHTVRTSVICTMSMTQPADVGPVMLELPMALPVELFPGDANVDEFKVDPSQRAAMRQALPAARVIHDEKGQVEVRVKCTGVPVGVAADVVLVQGSAEQFVGTLRIEPAERRSWCKGQSWQKPKFTGAVDVHLRPGQRAADDTRMLATYWGEEIVLRDVIVDAPYQPPFLKDESLRPAIVKALGQPKITRHVSGSRSSLRLDVNADSTPVKLAFDVFISRDGREVKGGSWEFPAQRGVDWHVTNFEDNDEANTCEVIFRPDFDWEIRSLDATPPWFGEIVFPDVPIEPSEPSR